MQIIGLGHYSRTGKDTLARMIINRANASDLLVAKQSFAWKLKGICHELLGRHGVHPPEVYDMQGKEHLRTQVIPSLGKSPVDLWIEVGNKMREVYAPIWIEYTLNAITDADVLIIPDVRFPNEVAAIRERGGWLVKVVREGHGPKDTVSDRALLGFDDWDYVAGPTMGALMYDADYLAECLKDGVKPTQSAAMRAAILEREKQSTAKAA